jgi:hypothetical protein
MLLVLFLINTYLQKDIINYWVVFGSIYAIWGVYFLGYNLIKESCNE